MIIPVIKRIIFVLALAIITWIGLEMHQKSKMQINRIGLDLENQIATTENLMHDFASGKDFDFIEKNAARDLNYLEAKSSELNLIDHLQKEGLIALVYTNGILRFWSSNLSIPDKAINFPTGLSYQTFHNGIYLVKHFHLANEDIIFLCQVKRQFDLQNVYLTNEYTSRFSIPAYISLSPTPLAGAFAVHSLERNPLFYLYINPRDLESSADNYAAIAWIFIFGFISFIIKTSTFFFAEKRAWLACLITGVFFPIAIRTAMIIYRFPHNLYNLKLFSPLVYSSSSLFYSLGDFCLNILLILWLSFMILQILPHEWISVKNKILKWTILVLCAAVQCSLFFLFERLFKGLVENSNIPFDLANILAIDHFSIISFALLSLTWLSLYLISRLLLCIISLTSLSKKTVIFFICCVTLGFTAIQLVQSQAFYFSMLCGALTVLIYLRGTQKGKMKIAHALILVLLISVISALRLLNYVTIKENVNRLAFAEKLEKSSDPVSEFLLKDNEVHISEDTAINKLFHIKSEHLKPRLFREATQHLQKFYFGKNFSNFDLQCFLYDAKAQLISGPDVYTLGVFLSASNSKEIHRVSNFFYQLQTSLPDYIGIIPIKGRSFREGTLVVRISARNLGENNSFPELLMDGKTSFERRQEIYSYAYYKNGSLIDKLGKYPYSITDNEITEGLNNKRISYKESGNYNHLIYTPYPGNVIIVSQSGTTFFKQVAVFSYVLAFNLIFYSLCALVQFLGNLFSRANTSSKIWELLKRQRFLYKTRIRLSLISGVLLSLAVVGWVTLVYIDNQYASQQVDLVSTHINNLRKAFESEMPVDSLGHLNEKYNLQFVSLASRQASDLNFFDTNGDLQYTTLPKLFDRGLISTKMEPHAFYEMFVSGRTELVNRESIGKLSFLSVYAPVRNSLNQVAGYINLPYFSNQNEIDRKLSSFVSALINVYVLVFSLIGILAFFLASSITNPLALIQESLKQIKIGNANRPLEWKRDDEIGDLIKAYNQMVQALEDSAEKLSQSERETAWREMAKQVAHEIKNPLTPLKLGIQHLEQAWRNKDERFDEKFKKFSRTFIEQIESLSMIASEFSNFAKMPQPQEKNFDLLSLATLSADLFKESEDLEIELLADPQTSFIVFADRDQMLRVFNNLLKNALQAIPANKKGKVLISMWKDGPNILIEVKDNGIGIANELIPRIFMPNFTTKSSGMGLGLAFVKNVIESAKGSVSFSTTKEGTAFLISLPSA